MTSQRNNERGNIFAALFGAVALIGVVGAASTALMRGPLSTVVTVNQKAKADTQMQLAAKLAIMEAAQKSAGGDCDADGFIEPIVQRTPSSGEPVPSGGGLIPGEIGATKTDPWGSEYGYCVWNMKDIGTGSCSTDMLDGPTTDADAKTAIVLAIVSSGPDRTFQTSCIDWVDASTEVAAQAGDDIVHSFTYDDARGLSDGLWTLKQGSPNVATIDKEIELSKAASFLSETNFQGGARFDSGFLDLSAGGLMKLPTQATSGACNAANTGVLRTDTSGGGQLLQICDPAADVILDPDGDKWVDIGGSGGVGGNIDGLTDAYRHGASRNLFLGSEDANLNVDPAQASSNVALGLSSGEAIVSGDNNTLLGNTAGYNITTGGNNVMIGSGAGGGVTTGSNNIIIGNSDALAAGTSNELRISNFIFGDISGGRLGIGAAPGAGYKLDVDGGTVNADRYEVAPNVFYSTSGTDLLLGTSNTTRLVIDSAGLVGIGMAPSEELDVAGDIRASESFYADEGNAGAPAYSFDGDADTGIFSSAAGEVAVATNGLQRLVVDSSGNVGIGEPAPGQALDVVGNGEFSGYVLGESFRVNSDSGLYEQGTGVSLNVGGAPALTVLSSGEVGIGTTNPNMELEVAGAIRIGNTANGCAAGTAGSIKYTSAGDALEYCSSDGNWYALGSAGGGGGGIGTPRISSLQEASATNLIDNANYTQSWNWDSLTTETALSLGSSSRTTGTLLSLTSTASGASSTLAVNTTSSGGASINGISSILTRDGSGAANVAIYGEIVGNAGGPFAGGAAVKGVVSGANASGMSGVIGTAGGNGYGIGGTTQGGVGASGAALDVTAVNFGVRGSSASVNGYGGYFENTGGGWGLYSAHDVGIVADGYLNWGTTRGDPGYGIRDNSGIMEIKNSSGTWSPISSSGSVGGAPGADSQVVYNSNGTLGADANFTWDRATARMGLGVASPTGRLQTGDTIYDQVSCPAGYVSGDFDGEADATDCVSIGLTVLPDGNVGIGTTSVAPFGGATRTLMVSGTNSGDMASLVLRGHPAAEHETLGGVMFMNGANLGGGISSIRGSSADSAGLIFNTWNAGAGQVPMWIQPDGRISLGSYVAADLDLRLDVNGKVGATEYCDEAGLNCIDIANVSGAGGADTEVQFNSSGTLAGSPGFTWTEGSSALNVTGRVNVSDRVNIAGQAGSVPQLMRFGDLTDVDTTGAANGNAIIFDGTNWVVGSIGAGSVGAAGTDRQVQFNSNGSLGADANFVYTSAGDFIVGSSQMDDGVGSDMRMFFNKTKGAFRAGYAGSDEWDDANVGPASVALGDSVTASGNSSFAAGNGTAATAEGSVALGSYASATGNFALAAGRSSVASGLASAAFGFNTNASGQTSIAFGSSIVAGNGVSGSGLGDGSAAFGLIDDAVTITTPSQVTGVQSMGIFMGDQDGLVVSANNQMSLLGGKMVIDPRVPASNLSADTAFEVEGTIKISYSNEACDASREGSIRYMSNTDTFEVCAATASGWEEIGGNIEQVAGDPPVSNFVENLNDLGDVTIASAANGECLVYNGSVWADGACTASTPSAAGADRQIQFNSGNAFAADANFVYTSVGDMIVGSYQFDDTTTGSEDSRMFFNRSLAAFRAGSTGTNKWDIANVGSSSAAFGLDTGASGLASFAVGRGTTASGSYSFIAGQSGTASGTYSVGMGRQNTASGSASVALGHVTTASGAFSFATGNQAIASGINSTAIGLKVTAGNGTAGSGLGDGSLALGLIDDAVSITTASQVTGIQSMGIFMGDQDGLVVSENNQMSLLGGKMVIDPAVPATNLIADTALEISGTLKIGDGAEACDAAREGSIRYVSATDTFETCATAGGWSALGGASSAAGADRQIQFNSGNAFAADANFVYTSVGSFIVGSSQLDDDSGTTDDNVRMFFDKDNAAFRAGYVEDMDMWDVSKRGWASVALGRDTTASGASSVALGRNTQATGANAFAAGENSVASGDSSTSLGADTEASGYAATALGSGPIAIGNRSLATGDDTYANGENSTAMGSQTVASGSNSIALGTRAAVGSGTAGVDGNYSMALGLGMALNAWPKVTGNSSFGIFMGNQDYLDITTSNAMGLFGGKMVIDPRVPAVNLVPDTTLEVDGTIKIGYSSEACDANREGSIRYMSSTDMFEVCATTGAGWVGIASGGGGGSTPGGADTNVQFNSNGDLAGTADFAWDQASTTLSVSGVVSVGDKIAMGGVTGNLPTYLGLTGLSDVDTTGVGSGDALVYDGSEWVPGSAGATPGGANTYVQFNSNGALDGVAGFTWDNATTTLGVTGKINVSDRINIAGQAGNAPNEMTMANLGDVALSSPANGECLVYDGTNWENAACGGGGGGAISGLTAATATNTIDNLNFAQNWNWNTLTTGNGLALGSSSLTTGNVLYAASTNTAASGSAIYGTTNSTTNNAAAVEGVATGASGRTYGLYGTTNSAATGAAGVFGWAYGASAATYGGNFGTESTSGIGISAQATSATGGTMGGFFRTDSTGAAYGVYGEAAAGTGPTMGGFFDSASTSGTGVYGNTSASSGTTYGVYGQSASSAGYGGYFTNTSTGVALHAQGDITYTGVLTDTSDIRLKTDIQQLDAQDVLARLDQIDTYSFRMRDDVSGQLELGVMAQEVEKVFPELVRTASDAMGTKSVNYTGFVAPLIEATKTLKAENDNLKAELASLKTEQTAMVSSIDDLRADMNGMKAHTGYGIGKAGFGAGMAAGIVVILGGLGLAFMWNKTGLRRRRRAE